MQGWTIDFGKLAANVRELQDKSLRRPLRIRRSRRTVAQRMESMLSLGVSLWPSGERVNRRALVRGPSYDDRLRAEVWRRILAGDRNRDLCRAYGLDRKLVSKWWKVALAWQRERQM